MPRPLSPEARPQAADVLPPARSAQAAAPPQAGALSQAGAQPLAAATQHVAAPSAAPGTAPNAAAAVGPPRPPPPQHAPESMPHVAPCAPTPTRLHRRQSEPYATPAAKKPTARPPHLAAPTTERHVGAADSGGAQPPRGHVAPNGHVGSGPHGAHPGWTETAAVGKGKPKREGTGGSLQHAAGEVGQGSPGHRSQGVEHSTAREASAVQQDPTPPVLTSLGGCTVPPPSQHADCVRGADRKALGGGGVGGERAARQPSFAPAGATAVRHTPTICEQETSGTRGGVLKHVLPVCGPAREVQNGSAADQLAGLELEQAGKAHTKGPARVETSPAAVLGTVAGRTAVGSQATPTSPLPAEQEGVQTAAIPRASADGTPPPGLAGHVATRGPAEVQLARAEQGTGPDEGLQATRDASGPTLLPERPPRTAPNKAGEVVYT